MPTNEGPPILVVALLAVVCVALAGLLGGWFWLIGDLDPNATPVAAQDKVPTQTTEPTRTVYVFPERTPRPSKTAYVFPERTLMPTKTAYVFPERTLVSPTRETSATTTPTESPVLENFPVDCGLSANLQTSEQAEHAAWLKRSREVRAEYTNWAVEILVFLLVIIFGARFAFLVLTAAIKETIVTLRKWLEANPPTNRSNISNTPFREEETHPPTYNQE